MPYPYQWDKSLPSSFPVAPNWTSLLKKQHLPLDPELSGGIMAAKEMRFFMQLMESTNWLDDRTMLAYQAAVEYGIDIFQLEYILTLPHAERLRRMNLEP